ncbi:hypothetical protein [Bosea sp. BK604]|uniref:hypothetical protein n=1 Tax=Bosea sp. BK604 TaxID=2512180 RepID=UPI001050313A|nr:hypothetical protein [Bosea sp. BK604]
MAALVHIAGMIIAQQIARGQYPRVVAIPLSLLISRLLTAPLALAVFSFVLHQLSSRIVQRREPLRR